MVRILLSFNKSETVLWTIAKILYYYTPKNANITRCIKKKKKTLCKLKFGIRKIECSMS